MNVHALILLSQAATSPVPPTDQVGFDILIGGETAAAVRIDAEERIEMVDKNPHRTGADLEIRQGKPGSFALMAEQVRPYRVHAGKPCVPGPQDVLAFRISWRERGETVSALFADSCEGIPADLVDRLRPVGALIEAPPPADGETLLPMLREP